MAKEIKMLLPSAADLFSTQEERDNASRESVRDIPLEEISDFPNHPFKVKMDENMADMAESVKQYGVLVPALVREKPEGGYEMIAGHRRKMASELAEKKEIPCIVRNLTDDEAMLIMVDSNLQREQILPLEKAFAYKMKLDAMKRQAGRPGKNSVPVAQDLKGKTSRQLLGEQVGESQDQIRRYIRLTELITPILDMVDSGKIAIRPAVVVRPYPYGSEYHAGVKAIRPQLDSPERVEEILTVMAEMLNNTADFDRRYKFMQKVYHDLTDYRDGNMGLKSGNILEPSCAVGNFIGMKPESLSDCKIYGVEIDSISGRIAQQLYQKSTVAVQGYEEAELPDSFFDVAIGNVPFGQFKVSDRRYDKNNFLVHDYFFAKTLDKVRPGGVIAFITSSGTMDKKNPVIRKYIAQRAELLGAIRLPNDTFRKNAGTEVTSDILFLQKRDRMVEMEPDWLYLDVDENGITQNRYFVEHPEMVLGEMVMESTQYGMDSTCRPYEDASLESLLAGAVENIQAEIAEQETDELVEEEDNSIPADPSVANFSFTIYDGKIYYRENSRMKPVELSVTAANRVKGMVAIRDCVRELIAYQTEGYADTVIEEQQRKLNHLYDTFQKKYGILNARANSMVFSDDNSYPLLCSLEIVAEDGVHARKADMFHKRTIKPHQAVTKVDTASEALSLSLSEKARVDMEYMCSLTGKSAEEIEQELSGVIFRLPDVAGGEPEFVSEDEYLSGNVREKLKEAKLAAAASEVYKVNVEALEKVQPKDLTASEISVRLGATWIPISDVSEFMFQLLDTPNYNRWNIKIHFSKFTGEWNIEGKSNDKGNPKANNAYGTHRVNAYKIIEDTLNLRDTRVYDYIPTEDGKKKAVLNKEETAIAQGKQDLIKQAFQDWIWQNPERRQRLTAYYNENFNAIRPREYDGSHLNFYGMNPEIKLRQHQKNGAARIIYGGNSLLAYVVGAGKGD